MSVSAFFGGIGKTLTKTSGKTRTSDATNGRKEELNQKLDLQPQHSTLVVRGICGDVRIIVVGRNDMDGCMMSACGKDVRKRLRVAYEGDKVIVEERSENNKFSSTDGDIGAVISGGNCTVINQTCRVIVIQGGSTTVIYKEESRENELDVEVRVLAGVRLRLDNIYGTTTVEAAHGDLKIECTGVGTVRVGQVKNLTVNMSGAGDVDICDVDGNVDLDMSGDSLIWIDEAKIDKMRANVNDDSSVYVENGIITALKVKTSGKSSVGIGSDVVIGDADLEARDASTIMLESVEGRLKKRASGMSQISVG